MRSYFSLLILQSLMERVADRESKGQPNDSTNGNADSGGPSPSWTRGPVEDSVLPSSVTFRPCDYIDYFYGTGTGGQVPLT